MRAVNSIITASYSVLFLRGTKCSPASDYGAGAAMADGILTGRSQDYLKASTLLEIF
jgi:hypothetical protein